MDRSHVLRYLRIAASGLCLLASVLLIVLWVRSYFVSDILYSRISTTRGLAFGSLQGCITGVALPNSEMPGDGNWWLGHARLSAATHYIPAPTTFGFGLYYIQQWPAISFPHWFPVLIVGASAALPWIPWRFSLRTLLIATMLVAIVLGVVAVSV